MGHVDRFSFDTYLPNLNFALKSFRIPMYFFLSGLFFKTYSGFDDFLRKKVNNLIITLLFFHFLCSALWFPMTSIVSQIRPDIDFEAPPHYWIPSFLGRRWYPAGALWFLVALFGVNMMYYLFRRFMGRIGVLVSVVLCSLIGYELMKHKIELPFEFDIVLLSLPYFMLGSAVKSLGLLKPSKYDKYGYIVIIPCAFIVYRYSSDINLLYKILPNYFLLYLIPFIAILSLFWFCKNLKYIPLICHYGRYSIILLGTHQLISSYIWAVLHGFTALHGQTLVAVNVVLVLIIELPVISIMVRYFPRFTAQKEFFRSGWRIC